MVYDLPRVFTTSPATIATTMSESILIPVDIVSFTSVERFPITSAPIDKPDKATKPTIAQNKTTLKRLAYFPASIIYPRPFILISS